MFYSDLNFFFFKVEAGKGVGFKWMCFEGGPFRSLSLGGGGILAIGSRKEWHFLYFSLKFLRKKKRSRDRKRGVEGKGGRCRVGVRGVRFVKKKKRT